MSFAAAAHRRSPSRCACSHVRPVRRRPARPALGRARRRSSAAPPTPRRASARRCGRRRPTPPPNSASPSSPTTLDDRGDLALPDDGRRRAGCHRARRCAACSTPAPCRCVLGGDHSVTYPVLRAFRARPPATILHIDAHGDLYDEFPLPGPGAAAGGGRSLLPRLPVRPDHGRGPEPAAGAGGHPHHDAAPAGPGRAVRRRGLRHGRAGPRRPGRGAAGPRLRVARPRRPRPGLRARRRPSGAWRLSSTRRRRSAAPHARADRRRRHRRVQPARTTCAI